MPSKPSSSAKRARAATSLHGMRCWAISKPNLKVHLSINCGMANRGSGESRLRAVLAHAVDEQVDAFVVERDVAGDGLALRQRRTVRPHEVLLQLVAGPDRPVFGLALVRAVTHGLARNEQVH